jgi:hypothetical protein
LRQCDSAGKHGNFDHSDIAVETAPPGRICKNENLEEKINQQPDE